MRITGWVLLIIGVVFGLLLTIAGSFQAMFCCVLLVGLGWRLTRYGKGLEVSKTAAGASPGGATAATATQELPLSPQFHDLLRQYRRQQRRLYSIIIGAGVPFFGLIFALVSWDDLKKGDWSLFLILMAGVEGSYGLIVGGIYFFMRELPLHRDLRDPCYLRTHGPVQLVAMMQNSYMLRLIDRAFSIYQKPVAEAFKGVSWATVDYTRHAHFVFEARDENGRSLFQV